MQVYRGKCSTQVTLLHTFIDTQSDLNDYSVMNRYRVMAYVVSGVKALERGQFPL